MQTQTDARLRSLLSFLAPKNLHDNSLEGFGANKETAYRK